MLDLDKLEAALREQLAKETTESVEAWFAEYERNNRTIEIETMTHTNNSREYWLQVVPDEASEIKVFNPTTELMFILKTDWFEPKKSIDLPIGTYRIHSDSATITEAQAAELVEVLRTGDDITGYAEYDPEEDMYCGCDTAIESFQSLLRSLNINQRVIILEKLC